MDFLHVFSQLRFKTICKTILINIEVLIPGACTCSPTSLSKNLFTLNMIFFYWFRMSFWYKMRLFIMHNVSAYVLSVNNLAQFTEVGFNSPSKQLAFVLLGIPVAASFYPIQLILNNSTACHSGSLYCPFIQLTVTNQPLLGRPAVCLTPQFA